MKNNFCAVFSSSVGKTAFAVGLFALCLNTEAVTTYALIGSRQPVGTDVRFSAADNWSESRFPVSDPADTKFRIFGYGRTLLNDLPDDFMIYGIEYTQGADASTVKGNPLNICKGGISIGVKSSGVVTQRFENALNFREASSLNAVDPGDCLYMAGPVNLLAVDPGDRKLNFGSSTSKGTIVVAGGLRSEEVSPSCYEKETVLSGCTVVFASDVYLPHVGLQHGAHLIIRGGARFEPWGAVKNPNGVAITYSKFANGTVDIEDGFFVPSGRVIIGQVAGQRVTLNIHEKGILDSGNLGLRLGNNGYADLNVRGGTFFYRSSGDANFAEHGSTRLNIYSGRVVVGDNGTGDDRLKIYSTSTKEPVEEKNTVNLAGGELVCCGFKNETPDSLRKNDPIYLYFDGGVLRCTLSGNAFSFKFGGNAEQINAIVRSGGLKIDVRDNDVVWNAVRLRSTDETGMTDGGMEKFGGGKFTLGAKAEYTGLTKIVGGTFHIADTAHFSGAVELRPRTALSFDGETLQLKSLKSKSGVVKLASGQSLELESAPEIEDMLVFDVDASAASTRTLLAATGLAGEIAAKCAVRSPVAGMACTFSVDGDSLVLTVAAGEAPGAPALAASEDVELIGRKDATVKFGDEGWEKLALSGGVLSYTGNGLNLDGGDVRLQSSSTFSLASGAGNVAIDGPFDVSLASPSVNPLAIFKTAPGNRFNFVGEWNEFVYPWTATWGRILLGGGNFVFGPSLEGTFRQLSFSPASLVTVQDSSLSLAATTASATINPAVVGERTAMVLDGARIKADSAGSGTFDDYLAGVTTLVLGENGVNIDTCGNDVTILQTLTPTGVSTTAGLVKTGEGTLKLGGKSNWMFGPLVVSNGTLKAAFDTGIHRAYPEGAMALWTFDGDDPYADKTGHGYDLAQAHPGDSDFADVTFKSENAMTGKAAFFSESKKGALKAMNITCTKFVRQTVSAWVRLKDGKRSRGNANIVSTRVKADFSATGNTFDLAYKSIAKTNGIEVVGQKTGFGTVWGGAQATIWDSVVGQSPSVGEWHHVLMVNDNGVYSSYLDGVCYVDRYKGTAVGFLDSGYLITIGQGIANGEFMEPGGMIDEVAIYPRALSAAEVAQIYSGAAKEAVFPVTVCEGAVWDMNCTTAKVTSVAGAGSITNGQLTVAQAIYLDASAEGVLHIENPNFESREGTLSLGISEDEKAPLNTPLAILTYREMSEASAANLEKWTLTGLGLRGEYRKARISVDRQECVVYATVEPSGLMLIVR